MTKKEYQRLYYQHNRETFLAKAKERYLLKKAEILEKDKRYYAANSERIKARNRQYREDNIDRARACEQKYNETHREERRLAAVKYRIERRDTVYVVNANQRAKRKFSGGSHTVEDRAAARKLQKGRCAYHIYGFPWCDGDLRRGQWDHRVALAAGGTNDAANGQWLCKPCNVRKGASSEGSFLARNGVEDLAVRGMI